MADVLDLLSLAEARSAINLTTSTHDTELAAYVTAVSRRIDDLCGPVVARAVTEQHDNPDSSVVFLRQAPALSITTVIEYAGGVATTLTAESLTVNGNSNYLYDASLAILRRRSSWSPTRFGAQAVVITYQAGRYANTAAVDPKFKQAAAMMLAHLWRREQGAGTVTFAEAQFDTALTPSFAVPKAVLELLEAELRPPAVA